MNCSGTDVVWCVICERHVRGREGGGEVSERDWKQTEEAGHGTDGTDGTEYSLDEECGAS